MLHRLLSLALRTTQILLGRNTGTARVMAILLLGMGMAVGLGYTTSCRAGAEQGSETGGDDGIASLVALLGQIDDAAFQGDLLQGIEEGLKGRRQVTMPAGWEELYRDKLAKSPDVNVRQRALRLALVFGDAGAVRQLRNTVLDTAAATTERQTALAALNDARVTNQLPLLLRLAHDAALRRDAIAALASYDDPRVPATLLMQYAEYSVDERRVALDTLAARKSYAHALLDAVAAAKVPASDLSAETVRKLRLLRDKELDAQIEEHWGTTRTTPAEIAQQIAVLRSELTKATEEIPNGFHGRAVFARTCQQCHLLFGRGGHVGPDITGSHRANLDYVLTNVVDPNALIGKDYQAWNIFTVDGAVHVGLIVAENESALTLRTATEELVIPKEEIEDREQSTVSMMPVGLFDQMTPVARRNLVTYLASVRQLPMLVSAENAVDVVRGATMGSCQAEGEGWNRAADDPQLGGEFAPGTVTRRLATDIFLYRGAMHFTVTPQLTHGSVRIQLLNSLADRELENAVAAELIWDSQVVPQLRVGDKSMEVALPSRSLEPVSLVWSATATELSISIGEEQLVTMPLPDDFRGGQLQLEVSGSATGRFSVQLVELAAPDEASLVEAWLDR